MSCSKRQIGFSRKIGNLAGHWCRAFGKSWGFALPMAMLAVFWAFPAFAATLSVPSAAYSTISQAVKSASPGDTIHVRPGIYKEQVKITKSITLVTTPGVTDANGNSRAIIDGGGVGRPMEVTSPGVVLKGLAFRASGDDLDAPDACIFASESARGLRIEDNLISDCAFGIWINSTPDTQILYNQVVGRDRPVFSDRGNGIHLWRVRNALVKGNRINTVRDGIYISVSTASRVISNQMWQVRFGIHYMYNDDNEIEDNLTCNSLVGLAMMFSKRLLIRGNTAINNKDHGIFFRSILDTRIEGNRATGNGKGFVFNEVLFNQITQNHVADNRVGIEVTGGSEENKIWRNNFLGNDIQVKYTWRHVQPWDHNKIGNYWGDYLGWDANRDGAGDQPYYSANRADWLVQQYPQVKLLAASPLVSMMQMLEARFPILRPAGVVDHFPALKPFPKATGASVKPGPECGILPKDTQAQAQPSTADQAIERDPLQNPSIEKRT